MAKEEKVYRIVYTQPFTYVENGIPINGYLVRAILSQWDEMAEIHVPKLDAETVNGKLMDIVQNRILLDSLGKT